jgi:hypothetical protein
MVGAEKTSAMPAIMNPHDIAQAEIENVMWSIDAADMNIDDVGAISLSWEHHIELLHTALWHLNGNGFAINPLKYTRAVQEMDQLGYCLTPNGLKP